jgi:hypothetical protein
MSDIRFNCPKCQRPMVGDRALLSELITCPDCREVFEPRPHGTSATAKLARLQKTGIVIKYLIAVGFAILAGWFIFSSWLDQQRNAPQVFMASSTDSMTPDQRTDYWRAHAEFEMLKACTNDLVGITRVVSSDVADYDDQIVKWTGTVTAEHINSVGGVERTNMYYIFKSNEGDLGPCRITSGWGMNIRRS